MNFAKLAFAQRVLRVAAGEPVEKRAMLGALVGAAKGVGNMAVNTVKKRGVLGTAGLALAGLGAASAVGAGVHKARAYNTGFDPRVQAYAAQPQGPQQ